MESNLIGPLKATVAMIAIVSSLIFANTVFADQGALASPATVGTLPGNSRNI